MKLWKERVHIKFKKITLRSCVKMAAAKNIEFNENFISAWEIEECLWIIKSEVFKDKHLRQNYMK